METSHKFAAPAAINSRLWFSAIVVSLQSFLYGYVFACLNSCLVTGNANDPLKCYNGDDDGSPGCPKGTIYNDLKLSTFDAQLATSLVIIGAWIGCMSGSHPAEVYGRRKTILMNNSFFIIGAVMCSISNKYTLFLGRFIEGLGVGIESMVVPVLLAEISSTETRGTITLVHQVNLTFAIFLVGVISYGFVTYVDHGWQYIQAGAVLPSIIQLAFYSYVPESPKWLIRHGKMNEAEGYIRPLRPDNYNVKKEIESIIEETRTTVVKSDTDGANDITWKEVFKYKTAVIIGCTLMFFQAFTGINSVIFYSTTIFGYAGFSQAILATTTVGGINFMMSVVSTYLIDKTGRKVLLLVGTYLMLASLIVLSTVLITADNDPSIQGVIAVVGVLMYVTGFSIGLGAASWVVLSEIMPTKLRTKAISLFLSINWGANLIIGLVTLSTIDWLGGVKASMNDDETNTAEKHGVAYLYYFFSIVTFLCILFIHALVPETKGLSPEDLMGGNHKSVTVNEPLLSVQEEF